MKETSDRYLVLFSRVRILLSLTFILSLSKGNGQAPALPDSLFVLPDSVRPFTISNFYELILQNHPVAKQAALLSDAARQEIRLARGNFDPKIEADFLSKNYNDQEYYTLFNGSLKIPTILSLDPVVGLERNSGAYLNPERYVGNEFDYRQFYAGISLPLGRGLVTDERRAALRQAGLFQDMTEAEQIKIINKLLLDAANEYWQWYNAYYTYKLFNRSVKIAKEIFSRVRVNQQFGEASVVDTVQAKITWQQRIIEQQEAYLHYQNASIGVSAFLWDSLANPLTLNSQWAPVLPLEPWRLSSLQREELLNHAKVNHPELKKLTVKVKQLEIEKRLAAEYLKPQLNLNYYLLNQPFNPEWNGSMPNNENYKLGVDFSFPVFLRKERSKLALAKLKITTTRYEQSLAEREIINELQNTFNLLTNLQVIIDQQGEMMANYERLLAAELVNLEQGESDLFKINLQQEKLIQAQTKWLKLLTDFEKHKAYLYWAAGTNQSGT